MSQTGFIPNISAMAVPTAQTYQIRDATEDDLPGILEIYNDAILNTTATWMDEPLDLENRRQWMRDWHANGFPLFVAVPSTEEKATETKPPTHPSVLGYAGYGTFRGKTGYRFTAEVTIYTHRSARTFGIGSVLMQKVIDTATERGLHTLVGGIDGGNQASIRFHKKFGFVETGRMPEVGFKFGRWLDLALLQLKLPGKEEVARTA